ncbi:MAG: conjugative transposon protein TraM [Chryseobacterium sp.]|nr:MAG: conjugative transposon protein TraM [Chryseobacterium sp.]
MKSINFKKPRYVIPLICLPFILLLFYVFQLYNAKAQVHRDDPALQTGISSVAPAVSNKALEDKLQAFKQRYKKGDGYTALATIDSEESLSDDLRSAYNQKEKQMLDSISDVLKSQKQRYMVPGLPDRKGYQKSHDIADTEKLNQVLSSLNSKEQKPASPASDPMKIFRQQMAIVDSMNKAAVSSAAAPYSAIKTKNRSMPADTVRPLQVKISTTLAIDAYTIKPEAKPGTFIQAMVGESLTGFSGSRVSIRLACPVRVSDKIIREGTTVYAIISGFASQRVNLSISSIFFQGEILPVKLEVYDLDGIKGIYIPSSSYREFSRELSASAVSGLAMDSFEKNQQIMSLLGRMFQSTTGAVNKLIRSNKARISYPSMLYLVDQSSQH